MSQQPTSAVVTRGKGAYRLLQTRVSPETGAAIGTGTSIALSAVGATGKTGAEIATVGKAAMSGASAGMTVASLMASAGWIPAATTATTSSGLLAAAGVSAPAFPVGTIIAGGLGLAAGTIALVAALRKNKLTRKQAQVMAYQMGIPDAGSVPGFTAKAIRAYQSNPKKLYRLGKRVQAQLYRKGTAKGFLGGLFRSRRRLESKLRIISAVIAFQQAESRRAIAPVQYPASRPDYGPSLNTLLIAGGAFFLLLLAAATSSSRRAAGSRR